MDKDKKQNSMDKDKKETEEKKLRDITPVKDAKGGIMKTKHDTVKNSISNIR